MLNILGFSIPLPPGLEFLAQPVPVFLINTAAWIILIILVNFILLRILKFITRRIPGDLEDIVLAIITRPVMIFIGLYGLTFSLHQLPLLPEVFAVTDRITQSIVVLLVTHLLGRFLRDVIVYYGERWAARTETRLDDVLIPVLNLFGPLLLVTIAALVLLPMWGIDVTSALLGAGVVGLVLGLALQEPLGNIFSGLSLLIESPFKKGDLIQLPDGRISEVIHLGMRSTMLFSLDEQATIYLPNKELASSMLVNLTKPTAEQRYMIDVHITRPVELAKLQNMIFRIANGHPAVLSSDMVTKLDDIREQIAHIRSHAEKAPEADAARQALLAEAEKNERTLEVWSLKDALRNLIRGIDAREGQGLSQAERQELYCNFVSPVDNAVEAAASLAKNWSEARDAWVNDVDFWSQRKLWERRNEQLELQWERLKKTLYETDDRRETRLDDHTKQMLEWLEREYKVPPGYWKNPNVAVKSLEGTFDGNMIQLQLSYYVDNIRLEHDSRPQRVRTELNRLIHEKLVENGLW